MKMIPVESSNLAAVGYDPAERRLRVAFKSGAVHEHAGVPPEEYAALMGAESHGSHYSRAIRGRYESARVDDPAPAEEPAPTDALAAAMRRFAGEE